MQAIFECLGVEFSDTGFASMNINPTHSIVASKNGGEQNVITLTVTAYSNTHKIVGKRIFKFIDDKYKISPVKRLEHITIEDLESAYLLSREEILKEIHKDLQGRINVLTDKIDKLQQFYNKNE